jgi:hypothetical protein
MKTDFAGLAAVVLSGAAFLGCGGSTNANSNPPPPDSGAPVEAGIDAAPEAAPPVDHGMPSTTYPAFTPDVGQIVYQGGSVLKHPVIVPITWNTDTSGQPIFDKYAGAIGQSAYWQAVGKDYDVGPATVGGQVHVAGTPPSTLTDQDIQNLITMNTMPGSGLDAGAPEGGAEGGAEGGTDGGTLSSWPAPTSDTIYAFFLAPGTSLLISSFGSQMPMDACAQGIGGYHGSVTSSVLGGDVAYAVVPSCHFGFGGNTADQTTMSMSHELIEAATDPFSSDRNVQNIGWYSFDQGHFDWMYFNELQAEVGDTCEFYQEAFYQNTETSFPYFVQRIWSNSSILGGHHPCVPTPPGTYFNVTPLGLKPVTVTIPGLLTGGGGPQNMSTTGVRIPAGQTGTFMVGFYSDGPSMAWSISAVAGNPILGSQGDFLAQYNQSALTATIDKTSGVNGEKAQVTVTVTSTGATFNGELLTLTSTLNGVTHYMPVWIAGQ